MKRIQSIVNEKVNLSNLKTIFETLIKTENKIIDLQQFSAKDFSFLNQKFLSFHKVSKSLIIDISKLLEIILDTGNNNKCFENFLIHLNNISSVLKNLKKNFIEQTDNYMMLHDTLEYINVPLNNFRQNLFTLKLLSSNLKLDIIAISKKKQISGKIDDLVLILENICLFVPKIDIRIEEYQKLNEKLSDQHNLLKNLIVGIENDMSNIFELTDHYHNKINYSKSLNNDINEKNIASQKNVETIITKLQYEDIISQRIDHLKETHKETINNLKNILNDNGIDETSESILFQIKDIVGLQSTHLVHINNEFQKAIDVISETIKEYNYHMACLTDSSSELMQIFSGVHIAFNSRINSERFEKHIGNFKTYLSEVSGYFSELKNKTAEFNDCFNEVFKVSGHLDKINYTIENVSGYETLRKISGLLKDNLNLTLKIDKKIKDFVAINDSLNKKNSYITNDINKIVEQLKSLDINSFSELLKSISEVTENIDNEIRQNKKEQKPLICALHDLKYYQYFENNVNEIIQNLNMINEFFSDFDGENNGEKQKNVEHVKKRYTTHTEHDIHKNFSENEKFILDELIAGLDSHNDENADNIEFF